MKKIVLLFISFFIINNLYSQAIQGGFRGGLNFNQLHALGWQSNYNTNPFAGAYICLGKNRLCLQVETMITNQSVTTDTTFKGLYTQYFNNIFDSTKQGRFTFTKLQVPIILNYKFNHRFWIQFGAVYSNAISVVDKNSFMKTTNQIFATKDISLCGGLWLGVTKKISASARYTQALSDINNLNSISTITNPNTNSWKNQQIQLGIGYRVF